MTEADSDEMTMVTCPHCHRRTASGPFCDRCGRPLEEPPETESAEIREETPRPAPISSPGESTEGAPAGLKEPAPAPSTSESRDADSPQEPPPEGSRPSHTRSFLERPRGGKIVSCEFINIEYDRRQIFIENTPTPLRFRIMPLTSGLENLCIWVEMISSGGGSTVRERRIHWKTPKANETRTINFPFHPSDHGALCATLYFGFRKDGIDYLYEVDQELLVYPSDSNADRVLNDLTVNIHNDVRTGHAADVNIRESVNELEGLVRSVSPESRIIDVLNQLRNGASAFCILEVYPSSWEPPRSGGAAPLARPPEGAPPPGAKTDRLTLHFGDRCLQVIAFEEITLGKQRENVLATRIFDTDGKARSRPNERISRNHCRLMRRGREIVLADGRGERPSTWGTYLDGKPVDGSGRTTIAANGASALLTLAGAREQDEGVFALHLTPWTCEARMRRVCPLVKCPGNREIAALILRRCDGIPETYLGLWACCPLKLVFPELDGLTLWRIEGAFAWGCSARNGWLHPGTSLAVDGRILTVTPFQQYGMEKKPR